VLLLLLRNSFLLGPGSSICSSTYTYKYMQIYMYMYMYIYVYICTYIYVYIYACVCVCNVNTHVCTYISRVLKDFRLCIRHHISVEKSPGLNRFGLSAGPRFDSSRNPVNSNQFGFELTDLQARVLNYCFQ